MPRFRGIMPRIKALLVLISLLLGPPDNGIAQELPPPNHLARALKDYTFHKAKASEGDIITIIDFGLPIGAKRLWVYDVSHKKALFHTKVAHAGGSGESCACVFSDTEGSRLSCVGVFRTAEDYTGVFSAVATLKLRRCVTCDCGGDSGESIREKQLRK